MLMGSWVELQKGDRQRVFRASDWLSIR